MNCRITKRFCVVVLSTLILPAVAADPSVDVMPDNRRYTVEMIIFRYAQDVAVGSEIFVPDRPPELDPGDMEPALERQEEDLSDLMPETPPAPSETTAHESRRKPEIVQFVLLQEEDYALNDIFARLERLDVYEPLMHFGWTQATPAQEDAEVQPLSSFAQPPMGLDGDVSLYLSRYLHLAVNLQLDAGETRSQSRPRESRVNIFGDKIEAQLPTPPIQFRIVENRIVRNGELRYFDHPRFGVLAKVSRVEEADEDQDTGDTDELLGDIPQ